jgi:hypothetical protein
VMVETQVMNIDIIPECWPDKKWCGYDQHSLPTHFEY